MCGNIVCLAAVLLGVDARWPSLPDGGLQYVIQIEPYALDRRESSADEAIRSHVPPYLKDVRAYQIVMGTRRSARNVPTANVHSPIRTGVDTDWVPLPSGGAECRVWIKPEVLDELEKPGRVIEGEIPANVKKPTVFTISVGTKPPLAESSTTIEADPSVSIAAKADKLPVDPPPETLITPPLPPERSASRPPLPLSSIVPRPFGSPDPSKAQTTLSQARSPSRFPITPPDSLPDPPAFKPDAGSAQPATHWEQSQSTSDEPPQPKADSNLTNKNESSPEETATPRLPPYVTLIGLFASCGGNVFLLWFVWDFRSRYLSLLRRMGEVRDVDGGCVSDLERDG